MGLAIGVALMWMGAALLWVASHGTQARDPWEVYQQIIDAIRTTVASS